MGTFTAVFFGVIIGKVVYRLMESDNTDAVDAYREAYILNRESDAKEALLKARFRNLKLKLDEV